MTDRRITRQDLLDYQAKLTEVAKDLDSEKLRLAAKSLDLPIQVADLVLANPSSGSSDTRFTPDGRERIRQANRDFWVACPRPECNGVRHRKTHPHIAGSKGSHKTTNKARSAKTGGH